MYVLRVLGICHIAGAMYTWGTSLGTDGNVPRTFPNYKMTIPQNAIAITFNRSARSVRTQPTDCCQLDADNVQC